MGTDRPARPGADAGGAGRPQPPPGGRAVDPHGPRPLAHGRAGEPHAPGPHGIHDRRLPRGHRCVARRRRRAVAHDHPRAAAADRAGGDAGHRRGTGPPGRADGGNGADHDRRGQRRRGPGGGPQPAGARAPRRRTGAGARRSRRAVRDPSLRYRARGRATRRDRSGVVPARAACPAAAHADPDAADPGGRLVISRRLTERAGGVTARPGRLDGPVRRSPDRVPARRGTRDDPAGYARLRGAGEFLVLQP